MIEEATIVIESGELLSAIWKMAGGSVWSGIEGEANEWGIVNIRTREGKVYIDIKRKQKPKEGTSDPSWAIINGERYQVSIYSFNTDRGHPSSITIPIPGPNSYLPVFTDPTVVWPVTVNWFGQDWKGHWPSYDSDGRDIESVTVKLVLSE